MEQSPLTQQARPSFQPKIAALYESLFKEGYEAEKSEGFWTEFFLLKCHPPGMVEILRPLSSDDLLHLQPQTRELFRRAVSGVRSEIGPQDEIALDTLSVFLREILSKRYTNLSSDIIALLTGLDYVDSIFTDFVASLDNIIKNGRTVELRYKAIQTALCVACGGFQTGLLSYFTHRDFFPALVKFINDPETQLITYDPFVLLGILANYNKFEFQNPYQLRLADFVNDATIKRIVREIGIASSQARADYIMIQDDLPDSWSLGGVLSYVGLGTISGIQKPKTPPPPTNPEAIKLAFDTLPSSKAAILLPTYDFANANKLFCYQLIAYQEPGTEESPICAYISFTSYLVQHAHRSPRTTYYARTNLLVLRILLEDQALCKHLTSEENKRRVRLCRQRQPHLPIVRNSRVLITAVIDTVIDGINHNLKKKLDVDFYILCIAILQRALSYFILTRTRLEYHWSELWRSILSFIRFLTVYSTDLQELHHIHDLIHNLVNLVALALSSGDSFLPGAAEYDDLFYKLVETGEILTKFSDAYKLSVRPDSSILVLISVSEHYNRLIADYASKPAKSKKSKNLSPQQVSEVIKSGYETLSIKSKDGLDRWDKYREVDERVFLKKAARMVVEDLKDKKELEVGPYAV